MHFSDVSFYMASKPSTPAMAGYAVPLGVVIAAMLAGLVSLVSLIIAKENKVSEFRQAWVDAQRADLAELLSCALALASSPREDRAGRLMLFDACYARILLRDNPRQSVAATHRFTFFLKRGESRKINDAYPWRTITDAIGDLREELMHSPICRATLRKATDTIVIDSRQLLKEEWSIVKNGERWYELTRFMVGSLLAIALGTSAALLLLYVILRLL